ncbi:L,D-transpeptidase [Hyphomicrobium sp.]|jgi:lipoprotein-anchoring transpeptidase ErfK/SrfK|uniref:L,D-transpeptidase n=1 Tax=Hyphomicrobium sp. TaxID=82 RepID=UPI00356A24E1
MLRTILLAVAVAIVVPSVSAIAEPAEVPASGAATTTQTQSGTTTFFGKAKEEKAAAPVVAKEEPAAVKPRPRPLPPTLTATVDLSKQTMTVSVNGEERYRWRISSGTQQFATPTGNFSPQWTSAMWYSKKYDNAPMPNAVFINGGVAVHGTGHVAQLGSPASHGCIRLAPGNAKTFYNLVQRHGLQRTRVAVRGRPNWGDAIARRDRRRDDDYASGGSWFWGGSSNDEDSREALKRDRKKSTYVYIDGVRTKVYRRKDGKYAYKDASKRQRYSGGYAYAN